MRFPPPSVIATWPRPNYTDPPTRGPELLVTEVTTLSVALLCLALRLWVRVRQLHKAWWDDWVMVVAGVCCAGTTVDVILGEFQLSHTLPPAPLRPESRGTNRTRTNGATRRRRMSILQ